MRIQLPGKSQPQNPKHERASSLLFVGVLLFATLVVPGIALTTQLAMDVAPRQSEPSANSYELSAAEQETLRRFRHARVVHNEIGSSGRHCSASSGLGADSIFTGLCSETAY